MPHTNVGAVLNLLEGPWRSDPTFLVVFRGILQLRKYLGGLVRLLGSVAHRMRLLIAQVMALLHIMVSTVELGE